VVFYFLIEAQIPARGAISLGEFYADQKNSLFFGKALIEAYEYGEAQNWLGFLVCPSAERVLRSVGLFTGKRLNYAYTKIPYGKAEKTLIDKLPAYIVGNWFDVYEENNTLRNLNEMRARMADEKIRVKYDNTLEFIRVALSEELSMPIAKHKSCTIRTNSYFNRQNWVPSVVVNCPTSGAEGVHQQLNWEKTFSSKAEADEYAIQQAIGWIDQNR